VSKTFKVGFIGAGGIAHAHASNLKKVEGVELVCAADVSATGLAKFKEQQGVARTYADYKEMLAKETELDAISVCTPNGLHAENTIAALEAGKHVMVEKPMTLTAADALELNRIAARNNRVLMVGHLMEYHPAIPAIRKLILDGEIGEVMRIESRRTNHGTLRSDENVWWSFAPHDISIAVRLMGDWPEAVQCEGQCIVQPNIADVVGGTLRFPGNRIARIDVSWHDPSKTRELKVYGTKKWVVFDDALPWERKVLIHDRGFDVNPSAPPAQRVAIRQGGSLPLVLEQCEPLVIEASHFAHCIQTNSRPISDGHAGAAVVSVLEYGQRSLESGREVTIPKPEFNGAAQKAA